MIFLRYSGRSLTKGLIIFFFSGAGLLFPILSSAQVKLYSELDHRGTRQEFGEGVFRLSADVRSLTVPPEYVVVMSRKGRCAERCVYWNSHFGFVDYVGRDGTRHGVILAARGCEVTVKRIRTEDARLTVYIKTGGDDLRGGSSIKMDVLFNGVGNKTFYLNKDAHGLSNNSEMTFQVPVSGIRPEQIWEIKITHVSGSTSIFDTRDNWNVDELKISYVNPVYTIPLVLVKHSGRPYFRFTGAQPEVMYMTRGVFSSIACSN